MLAFFGGADPEIVADRAADILFPLFPSVPFGLTSPVDLARFTTIHLGIGHTIFSYTDIRYIISL